MTNPTPRPPRKPPAYPTLVACLIGTTALVGCKSSPHEAPPGGFQPTYGLGGAATTAPGDSAQTTNAAGGGAAMNGTAANGQLPGPPEAMGGAPPPTVVEPVPQPMERTAGKPAPSALQPAPSPSVIHEEARPKPGRAQSKRPNDNPAGGLAAPRVQDLPNAAETKK